MNNVNYFVGLILGFLSATAVFVLWPIGDINYNGWGFFCWLIWVFTFCVSVKVACD